MSEPRYAPLRDALAQTLTFAVPAGVTGFALGRLPLAPERTTGRGYLGARA